MRPLECRNYYRHRVSCEQLPEDRDVVVYLPEAYHREPRRRFPVVYLHDGNNLFDPETAFCGEIWAADQALEAGVKSGEIAPVILVGIGNTSRRTQEYTWHPFEWQPGKVFGGGGKAYCDFVAHELKPWIDGRYRTLPAAEHTTVAGSSLGGLISFYFGLHYADRFGNIGLMSPSLGWNWNRALEEAHLLSPRLRVWVDIGTRECSWHPRGSDWMVDNTAAFVAELEAAGFRHFDNLAFHIAEGADHSERAWAARIGHVLRFFHGPRAQALAA